MRLIDADALMKSINAIPINVLQQTLFKGYVDRAIMDAPTVGGWISVKDRLPEIGDTVLFTGVNNYGNRWLLAQRGWFGGTFWIRDDGETIYVPVTHWMPLPEQPEEK